MTRLDNYINKIALNNKLQANIFVAKGSEVLLERSFGYGNIELKKPLTPSTIFKIGSVTKQMTAALILKLVEENVLDLFTPISTYLDSSYEGWKNNKPSWANEINSHQLLAHCAGIPDYMTLSHFVDLSKSAHTKRDIIDIIAKQDLLFEPGTLYEYSNSGYILLGEIMEQATGQSYDDLMDALILEPLGLKNTMSIRLHHKANSSGFISSHQDFAYGYLISPKMPDELSVIGNAFPFSSFPCQTLPDGSLISTARDLHLWNLSLYKGKVIGQEGLQKMLTPHVRIIHPPSMAKVTKKLDLWYGYGIACAYNPILKTIFYRHGGIGSGFRTELLYLPAKEVTVAYLSNVTWSDQRVDPLREIRRHVQILSELAVAES
ncbi:MAG: beta-lactamase family protein [Alphaproteobacteria bacterium]|nr:beta-lactamase family protein [Alphaproteobacteria bacterium]